MMIKVSELKKRGIKVVVGDLLSNGKVINDDWKNILNHFDVEDLYVTEFAPRKNTGDIPVYGNVMVEATLESGEVVDRHAIDLVWKDTGDDGQIISWIPSMKHLVDDVKLSIRAESDKVTQREISDHIASIPFSQKGVVIDRVEAAITTLTGMDYTFNGGTHWKPPLGVKPVFTQAMVDSGELPPVGSFVLVNGNQGKVITGKDCHGVIVVGSNGFWVNAYVRDISPLPTERDLTTNDLENIIASQGFLNKDNITEQMANLIYNAGYRKSDK